MKNDLYTKLFVFIVGLVVSMGTYFISNSFSTIEDALKEIQGDIKQGQTNRSLLSERLSIQEERCRKACT